MVPNVSIVILNWNGKKDTLECLDSLKHVSYHKHEVILVDNGSTDESIKSIKEKYPNMNILENIINLGFAKGCNIGIEKALQNNADYVLLLNNDVTVEPDFLDKLISVAENNDKIGILGPKINYYDDPETIWSAGGYINYWICLVAYYGMNKKDQNSNYSEKAVDYISGCAMLLRSSLIKKIGAFDERYFAYFEDADLCVRAKRNEYILAYVPSAKIYHKVSRTSGGALSPFSLYYNTRNKLLFVKKHTPFPQILPAFVITMAVFNARILYLATFQKDFKGCTMILKGIKDAFTGRFGHQI